MSNAQIKDIYDRLNSLSEEMAAIRALSKFILWLVGGAVSASFAVGMAVFVWWLNKP